MNCIFSILFFLILCSFSPFAFAQSEEVGTLKAELEQIKVDFKTIQEQHMETINLLQARIERLEQEKEASDVRQATIIDPKTSISSDLYSKQMGGGTVRLMDISFDSLFTVGGSSARESEIDQLQGGAHDPKKRGFTTQNLEFSMLGAVDPYINGEAHLIYQIDKDGESKLEVEEAFLTTQSLPQGLQLKAGTYFTEFGRLNSQHPHSWAFVDQPVVNTRMFGGDGLRSPGARLSWLTPLPWYSEVFAGAQNANGETAFSFLSEAGEDFSGHTLLSRDVRSAEDLLYSTRWLNSVNLSDEVTVNLGASALFGPNATGLDNRTNIYGTDLYLKWQPLSNDAGFPFIASQTEFMKRDYEAGADKDNLNDSGLYTQLLWGFKKNWVAGLRYDLADGDGAATDYLRDRRYRVSPNLSWHPTEFSKVRLQYNYDKAEHINDDTEHSIWLQYEFMLGSHPKHKF